MRKLIAALAATVALLMAAGPAYADGVIDWTGHGSENLPCEGGAHWVLAPAFGIDSATLTVDGATYVMTQNGQGSFAADSSTEVTESSDAYVTYTGEGDERDQLQLSHCLEGSPTPTPTPTDTGTPTPTPTPTRTHTHSPKPTKTPSTIPTLRGHSTGRHLAETGLTSKDYAVGGLGLLLALIGAASLRAVAMTERKRKALFGPKS